MLIISRLVFTTNNYRYQYQIAVLHVGLQKREERSPGTGNYNSGIQVVFFSKLSARQVCQLEHVNVKNVNLTCIYSGHTLNYTSTKLSYMQSTGMLLKQRKQIIVSNKRTTQLKIPTGRMQTRWVFTKHDQGFEFRMRIPQHPRWQTKMLILS